MALRKKSLYAYGIEITHNLVYCRVCFFIMSIDMSISW